MMKTFVYVVVLLGVGIYFLNDYMEGCDYDSDVKLDGKVAIVTGANTGIGKETVIDFVKRGARVYLGCRSEVRGQAAVEDIKKLTGVSDDQIILLQLDLASLKSIQAFVDKFKQREDKLDLLINNAGVMWVPQSKTEDGFETTFGVNHLGHFLLTTLLTDRLIAAAPSRVVTVSSRAHLRGTIVFDDLMGESSFSRTFSYAQSKLANVLFARELARKLEDTGVTSYSLHPGAIITELARHAYIPNLPVIKDILFLLISPILKDSWHGARTTVFTAVEPGIENLNGKYFSDCAPVQPITEAEDDTVARKLWDVSIDLLKLNKEDMHPKLRS